MNRSPGCSLLMLHCCFRHRRTSTSCSRGIRTRTRASAVQRYFVAILNMLVGEKKTNRSNFSSSSLPAATESGVHARATTLDCAPNDTVCCRHYHGAQYQQSAVPHHRGERTKLDRLNTTPIFKKRTKIVDDAIISCGHLTFFSFFLLKEVRKR